ncbi:hypothetical protein [Spiroplasma endosymbiont of Crioceris asparagi]|uniref:hypothetical protein n=1 Tax=Spiroplasma endosymbiont of Crioceris asparagi TaxID=3066286 RepID=UPI0030CBE0E7
MYLEYLENDKGNVQISQNVIKQMIDRELVKEFKQVYQNFDVGVFIESNKDIRVFIKYFYDAENPKSIIINEEKIINLLEDIFRNLTRRSPQNICIAYLRK